MGRVLELDTLLKKVRKLKEDNKVIVFTNGCFDILHRGHIHLLKEAKKLGDVLVVGLNSDKSVKKIKGPLRPLKDQRTRSLILSSLCFVDYVVIFDEPTPYNLIKKIKPSVLVKGGDWRTQDIVGSDIVRSYSGKIVRVKYLKGHSTTSLVNKIKNA